MNSDSEQIRKQSYINETIIEKGYNPEELANYIIQNHGISMDQIKFEDLKNIIENFKSRGLKETFKMLKSKAEIYKETNSLYKQEEYSVACSEQQKNVLTELNDRNQNLTVEITDVKIESQGGFFSRPVYSFSVKCGELGSKVKRTLADFEWLRTQLVLRYSLRFVPPIMRENLMGEITKSLSKNEAERMQTEAIGRSLGSFVGGLTKKTIFRTSPLLYRFLKDDERSFAKYKEEITRKKFELSIKMDNFKSMKKEIKCKINEEIVNDFMKFPSKINVLNELYSKLDKALINVCEDFSVMQRHLKELSDAYSRINDAYKVNVPEAENLIKITESLKAIFLSWSKSYENQLYFFGLDFREKFAKFNAEISETSKIHQEIVKFKTEYEDFSCRINKKKEEL